MKRVIIGTGLVMVLAVTAFAGKEERDMMTKEVQPAVTRAEAAYKSSCGCPLKITIDDSIKTKNDLYLAKSMAEWVADGVGGYCTDAASKKAICQMQNLTIAKASKIAFTFKGGTGVATTDGSGGVSWGMITRELDK
jgi:hypothetical protein